MTFPWLAFGILFSSLSPPALIQSQSQPVRLANVAGLVMDNVGAFLPRVIITFKAKKIQKQTVVAGDGRYELELPAGTYEVIGRLQGCNDFRLKRWDAQPATHNTLNLSLHCAPTPIP
jgi:hypothetical protein